MPKYTKRRYAKKHYSRKGYGKKHTKGTTKRMNAIGKVPKIDSKQAMKYLQAKGQADLTEQDGAVVPHNKAPSQKRIGIGNDPFMKLLASHTNFHIGDLNDKKSAFKHTWKTNEIFRMMWKSKDMITQFAASNWLTSKTQSIAEPTDVYKKAMAGHAKARLPWSQVRLRKIHIFGYTPDSGKGYLSFNWFDGSQTEDEVRETRNFKKWKWFGFEAVPPIRKGLNEWITIEELIAGSLDQTWSSDNTKGDFQADKFVWFVVNGNLPQPAQNPDDLLPDQVTPNLRYIFDFEYRREDQDTDQGDITFAAVTADGTIIVNQPVEEANSIRAIRNELISLKPYTDYELVAGERKRVLAKEMADLLRNTGQSKPALGFTINELIPSTEVIVPDVPDVPITPPHSSYSELERMQIQLECLMDDRARRDQLDQDRDSDLKDLKDLMECTEDTLYHMQLNNDALKDHLDQIEEHDPEEYMGDSSDYDHLDGYNSEHDTIILDEDNAMTGYETLSKSINGTNMNTMYSDNRARFRCVCRKMNCKENHVCVICGRINCVTHDDEYLN